jgi:regulator of cell morphogenesis and NO signaling
MYQIQKTSIKPNFKMFNLILENHLLLLMLEHFEIDFAVNNKTVEEICRENNIRTEIFIAIGNIYNGYSHSEINEPAKEDVLCVLKMLKNTHQYYKQDKYPEIRNYIKELYKSNNSAEIVLIEKFFNEYFNEVIEHLDYEDDIAFPYFFRLLETDLLDNKKDFSAHTYKEHHTDIEYKLEDLKSLLLKHLNLKNDLSLIRKLLFSLFELEFDLNIHSMIEEKLLIPMVQEIEK